MRGSTVAITRAVRLLRSICRFGTEGNGRIDEQIDFHERVTRIVHREDHHTLVVDPPSPRFGVSEIAGVDRSSAAHSSKPTAWWRERQVDWRATPCAPHYLVRAMMPTTPSAPPIVEKPGYIALPVLGTAVAYWAFVAAAVPDLRMVGLVFGGIPAALLALDLVLAARRRSMRAVGKTRMEIVDRKRPRIVKRRHIRVVKPSDVVTLVLIAALLLLASAVVRGNDGVHFYQAMDSEESGELYGALLCHSVMATIAVALYYRWAYRRVVLQGERWGAWFARADVDRLFAAPSDERAAAFVPRVEVSAQAVEAQVPGDAAP